MPIQDRKYYIMRHNKEQEEYHQKETSNNGLTISDEGINAYAALEQKKRKNI